MRSEPPPLPAFVEKGSHLRSLLLVDHADEVLPDQRLLRIPEHLAESLVRPYEAPCRIQHAEEVPRCLEEPLIVKSASVQGRCH